jgi:serine/threonine protein kinase
MHSCVGTPYYMSPQILQRLPYSSKAEVYALGALLFEMLTGATPWQEAKSYCELVELAIAAVPRFGSV